jgi:hypothetical protein
MFFRTLYKESLDVTYYEQINWAVVAQSVDWLATD